MSRTELGTLGEFGLINRIKAGFETHHQASTLKGIGDDCAVIDLGNDEVMVISTDFLVEGVHFDLSYTPLKHLGYKCVAVNVSDVAAMNAVPTQITVSIALSNRFSVEAVDELYAGISAAADNFKVDVVGGDTTSSLKGLIVSITVIGRAKKADIAYRSGAKVGDVVCITGDLGGAYAGLQVLEREKQEFLANPEMQPQLDQKDYIVQRLLKPEARMDVIYDLKEKGVVPNAMIDISDGLASEILHICDASNVGVLLYEDKLPVEQDTLNALYEFKIDTTTAALNGGEDYELLFTVSLEDFEKIKNQPDIIAIGLIHEKEKGHHLVSGKGYLYPIKAQGWNHLSGEK